MPALNKIKFRSWNYFLLHTKDHVIQFNFVDISLGFACPSSLVVFAKNDLTKTLKKVEALF